MDCSLPGTSVHRDSPGQNTGVGCHAPLKGIFQPRDQTQPPTLRADSLPAELPGKPPKCSHLTQSYDLTASVDRKSRRAQLGPLA